MSDDALGNRLNVPISSNCQSEMVGFFVVEMKQFSYILRHNFEARRGNFPKRNTKQEIIRFYFEMIKHGASISVFFFSSFESTMLLLQHTINQIQNGNAARRYYFRNTEQYKQFNVCYMYSIDSDLYQGQWGKSRHSHRFALCCVALHILFNSTWIFMSVLFFC